MSIDDEVHDEGDYEDDYEEEIVSDEDVVGEEETVVEIAETELEILEYRSKKLSFLEAAGVENWEGYDNAMEDMANFEGDVDE